MNVAFHVQFKYQYQLVSVFEWEADNTSYVEWRLGDWQ